ncbi:MAG: adenine phosphoribosyltransferase [Treponema sp.]|nr:adenine phosphoribosyltransferase [Treponema sp.]
MDIELLDKAIRRIPDFPKPGILFYDITSVLTNPEAFKFCLEEMYRIYKDAKFDAVAGVESRGFIFAAPLAEKLGIPLVLIRKKGKLPGDTYQCSYDLEYGSATIEVHKADIKKGQKILVVDDLIATGGTLAATKTLIQQGGAEVTDFFGVIGLPDLNYEKVLAPCKVTTLINYHGE